MPRELNSLARARPLAELSLEHVVSLAELLAQRWAAALVIARSPDDLAGVPLQRLASEGPALCAQVLRALESEVDLERLTGKGAPSGRERPLVAAGLAALAGSRDAAETVAAVEILRGVLWEALLEELPARGVERALAELSDRLAYVCSSALAVAVSHFSSDPGAATDGAESAAVSMATGSPQEIARPPAGRPSAVIVDERAPDPPAREPKRPVPSSERRATPQDAASAPTREPPREERPLSWDESPPIVPAARREELGTGEIAIRDERGEEGPAAWIGSIGRQLSRYADDGVPFAVLLVEPLDLDRLHRMDGSSELPQLAEQLEEALAVTWPGSLTRQRAGRYWLLAPATNRLGARELAERLRQAVAASVSYRGLPLQLAVGTAACPDDGLEAPALAAHADVALYAARSALRSAAGRVATPVDEPA